MINSVFGPSMIIPLLTEQHCLEWQMCSFHWICTLALCHLILVVHEHGGICHIVSLSLVCACHPPHGIFRSGQFATSACAKVGIGERRY